MRHTNEVKLVENSGWDERILICRNAPLVDTYIVVTQRYVVVVDTMINAATGEKLLDLARPYLTNNGRALLVVNTHADYDHSWGNQAFAASGAPIMGHRLSPAIFSQPESAAFLYQVQADEPQIFGDVVPTPPNILFDEKLAIDGGDLTLELFATPGHTVDHTSLYIPEIRTLLAADAAELPYPMARTVDGLPGMRQSLARLARLDAETVLYCHAPVEVGVQLLHDNIAYFDRLEAACRAALAGSSAPPQEPERLIEWVGLPYAEAAPDDGPWRNVHAYYRVEGHAEQIRQMLAWLTG